MQNIDDLLNDLNDLREINDQLNKLVTEEQEYLDAVERSIKEADTNVTYTNDGLSIAEEYKKSYFNKKIVVTAVCGVIGGAVGCVGLVLGVPVACACVVVGASTGSFIGSKVL